MSTAMSMEPPPAKPTSSLFEVYLRLRPSFAPNAERFMHVGESGENKAPTHITMHPPANDQRKKAIETFKFTKVFEEEATQLDLFRGTGLDSIIQGVLGAEGREGRDGLLATLGVTGSGKSHTILGSPSQRGLTQLALDVLYQSLTDRIVPTRRDNVALQSLVSADGSEAHMMGASQYIESVYGDNATEGRQSRAQSRAATPLMVRDSPNKHQERGLYPNLNRPSCITNSSSLPHPEQRPTTASQAKSLTSPSAHSPTKPSSIFSFLHRPTTRSQAKTQQKDVSFMSAATRPSSAMGTMRRHLPRLSNMPQFPIVQGIDLDVDQTAEFAIVVSMYEVYNDRIFDLLAGPTANQPPSKTSTLKRRHLLYKSTEQNPDRKVVAGLRKVVCENLDEALLVLETGLTERKVAGTGSNAASSRSHGFFCVEVKKRLQGTSTSAWSSSTLTIVDLAGSERARNAKTAGATLAEAGKINESLMYLGQCMQMQSDNADLSKPQAIVPFRQCKLTELLFSNSFPSSSSHHAARSSKQPQKAIMVVTADPLGDYNATSQILRYSALAREVTVPRIPSLTSQITPLAPRPGTAMSGRMTPTLIQQTSEDLENALREMALLREDLELTRLRLEEEVQRRRDAESSWVTAESRLEVMEAELRDEIWSEMEVQMLNEQRRWRAARLAEQDRIEEHMDRKLEILTKGLGDVKVHEDDDDDDDEEAEKQGMNELEEENRMLRQRLQALEREKENTSPVRKMRVLKPRKWEGKEEFGVGLYGGSP